TGMQQAKTGRPASRNGNATGEVGRKIRDTLIQNQSRSGIGLTLQDEPKGLPTWPDPTETRVIEEGLVFTIEPFLSLGADWAEDGGNGDPWTLYSEPRALTVQYEHTIVATKNGPIILTLPG